ncbi:hypothetical protein [Plantactinospora sp. B24E8]|uniref:hypothetical protein n=2 Tax=unclassified Plantactinospora TaxID=2631981 RepID=UPI00325F1AFB
MSVETWSRMPLILPDERPFDYAREGFVVFPDERWCIIESCDSAVQVGVELPSGPGEYGVRVVAYHHNTVRDRYEEARAGSAEEFAAALTELRQPDSAAREWYRIQLWPVGRGR